MRKSIIAAVSAIALAFTLSACSDKAKEQAEAAKKQAEAADATKDAAAKAVDAAKEAAKK